MIRGPQRSPFVAPLLPPILAHRPPRASRPRYWNAQAGEPSPALTATPKYICGSPFPSRGILGVGGEAGVGPHNRTVTPPPRTGGGIRGTPNDQGLARRA